MGKFAARSFVPPDLEKDAINFQQIGSAIKGFGQAFQRGGQALLGGARRGIGTVRQAGQSLSGGLQRSVGTVRQAGQSLAGGARHAVNVGGIRAEQAASRVKQFFRPTPRPQPSLPAHTMQGTVAELNAPSYGRTAFQRTMPAGTQGTVQAAPTAGTGGSDTLIERWQRKVLENLPTAHPTMAPGSAGTVALRPGSAGGIPRINQPPPGATTGPIGPRPSTHGWEAASAPSASELSEATRMKGLGVPEERVQQLLGAFGGRGIGPTTTTPLIIGPEGRMMRSVRLPAESGMVHAGADKLNLILLDIIERSKPGSLIKTASTFAFVTDEGLLKVASPDNYWLSARGACHLEFLRGVNDVDPEMAWVFAKNAGLIGSVGKLLGGAGRALKRVKPAFGGAAQDIGQWWRGVSPRQLGTAGQGVNPLRQAGTNIAARVKGWGGRVKQEFAAGRAAPAHGYGSWPSAEPSAGMPKAPPQRPAPAPAPAAAPAGASQQTVGQGPYRQAPAPPAGEVAPAAAAAEAPAAAAGAAGEVAPRPGIGSEAWGATKSVAKGIRNLGYGALLGGTVLGSAALGAAGNLVQRPAAPYQYGMGGPSPWMYSQQM